MSAPEAKTPQVLVVDETDELRTGVRISVAEFATATAASGADAADSLVAAAHEAARSAIAQHCGKRIVVAPTHVVPGSGREE